jgi:hypothetical protein
MQPHEQRVVDERTELDDKLGKLIAFIDASPIFKGLDKIDQDLLIGQKYAMMQYSELLTKRIGRFEK